MNRRQKLFSILFFLITFTNISLANIAMPGYWSTGTGRTFFPFFKEDSAHFGKIQMKEELITIQLYKGFAVVKGVYKMLNLSGENVMLRVGFPINGTFDHPVAKNVMFDELYNLKVLNNGVATEVQSLSDYVNHRYEKYGKVFPFPEIKNPIQTLFADNSNWYVWETNFKANEITEVVVYYVVNTNDASQLEGYTKNHSNCFSYILESGEAWGKDIEKGKIIVQLMEGISDEEIDGLFPFGAFKFYEGNFLIYEFENLNPTNNNNVLIRYSERDEKFRFEEITNNIETYFASIDKMNLNKSFKEKNLDDSKDDFEVHTTAESPIVFIVSGIVLLGLLIYGIISWIF